MTRRGRSMATLAGGLLLVGLTYGVLAPPATAAGTGAWGTADFDGDGDDELVIAVPSESLGTIQDAGAVVVLEGSPAGVVTTGAAVWSQGTAGIPGQGETGDRFGESWTTGDFDGDGFDDLAMGIPGDNTAAGVTDVGRVQVLYGSPEGLSTTGQILLREPRRTGPQAGERFGTALAAGDFDGDGFADLAVGAPGETVGGASDAGALFVFAGSSQGLTQAATRWTQDTTGIADATEDGDRFGTSLAAGRVGRGARDDLVIGVPREDVGRRQDTGVVHVLYGAAQGFSTRTDQRFSLDDFGAATRTGAGDDALSSDTGDRFGSAVAIATQHSSDRPIVVAGAPYDDDPSELGTRTDTGSVALLLGDDGAPVEPAGGQSPGLFGSADDYLAGERFGSTIAGMAGAWVVGSPGHDAGAVTDAGLATTLSWSTLGGDDVGIAWLRQLTLGETDESGDMLGAGVWAADVDGDGEPELALGWRESDEDTGVVQGGMVAVVGAGATQLFTQSTPGVPETDQDFDRFGTQLLP